MSDRRSEVDRRLSFLLFKSHDVLRDVSPQGILRFLRLFNLCDVGPTTAAEISPVHKRPLTDQGSDGRPQPVVLFSTDGGQAEVRGHCSQSSGASRLGIKRKAGVRHICPPPSLSLCLAAPTLRGAQHVLSAKQGRLW